jgi:hypothetical protein
MFPQVAHLPLAFLMYCPQAKVLQLVMIVALQ